MTAQYLFAPKYFAQVSTNFYPAQLPNLEQKKQRINDWISSIKNGTVIKDSEIQLQTDFLQLFFGEVLDYMPKIGYDAWNLDSEFFEFCSTFKWLRMGKRTRPAG